MFQPCRFIIRHHYMNMSLVIGLFTDMGIQIADLYIFIRFAS
jgi:hypothetical protein